MATKRFQLVIYNSIHPVIPSYVIYFHLPSYLSLSLASSFNARNFISDWWHRFIMLYATIKSCLHFVQHWYGNPSSLSICKILLVSKKLIRKQIPLLTSRLMQHFSISASECPSTISVRDAMVRNVSKHIRQELGLIFEDISNIRLQNTNCAINSVQCSCTGTVLFTWFCWENHKNKISLASHS